MRRLSLFLLQLFVCASLGAQEVIDLTGSWDFAVGDSAVYKDFVQLPGTMLSNGNSVVSMCLRHGKNDIYLSSLNARVRRLSSR